MISEAICKLDSGNWVGSYGGPEWSPYAQAIADHYAVQVPWYLTIPTTLTGVALQRRTILSVPYQHDILIFGAHINIGTDAAGDNGQLVFLQVTDLESGVSWVTPNIINSAPATAFGGSRTEVTPILKLPEVYFLPKYTRLKFDWSQPTGANVTGGSITWCGVQLSQPRDGKAPEFVATPNGETIRVGSRMPWLSTVGLGRRTFTAGDLAFQMVAGGRYLQYTPPVDCAVEIHDIHCNFFTRAGVDMLPNNVMVKITDAGERGIWTPDLAPIPSTFGSMTQVYPGLPFTKPYLMKPGHRFQLSVQNNNAALAINDAMVTIRGVRLCEY